MCLVPHQPQQTPVPSFPVRGPSALPLWRCRLCNGKENFPPTHPPTHPPTCLLACMSPPTHPPARSLLLPPTHPPTHLLGRLHSPTSLGQDHPPASLPQQKHQASHLHHFRRQQETPTGSKPTHPPTHPPHPTSCYFQSLLNPSTHPLPPKLTTYPPTHLHDSSSLDTPRPKMLSSRNFSSSPRLQQKPSRMPPLSPPTVSTTSSVFWS